MSRVPRQGIPGEPKVSEKPKKVPPPPRGKPGDKAATDYKK